MAFITREYCNTCKQVKPFTHTAGSLRSQCDECRNKEEAIERADFFLSCEKLKKWLCEHDLKKEKGEF